MSEAKEGPGPVALARGWEDGCGGRRGAGLSLLLQPGATAANLCVKSLGSWCGDAGKGLCVGTREM